MMIRPLIRPFTLLSTLLAVLPVQALAGGLTLNWGGCLGSGAHPYQSFNCADPNATYDLVMELQPPTLTAAFAVDVVLDLQIDTPGLDSFWHMEPGGCNDTGLSGSANRSTVPNTGCLSTITGSTGAGVSTLITGYGPGFGAANRGRILVSVVRSASSPVNLSGTANYYLSHVTFSVENSSQAGGTCVGCTERASLVWSSAAVYTISGSTTIIDNSGLASNCTTINGVGTSCGTTPTVVERKASLKAAKR